MNLKNEYFQSKIFNQISFDNLQMWCKLIMISTGWDRFNPLGSRIPKLR